MLLVGVCRWGFRLLAGDLYIYMYSVGVDVCILCVGFMLYGWVYVTVYMCCVCRCVWMFGGGHFISTCRKCGVCVHSGCGLHVVWLGLCWGLFVLCLGGYFSFRSMLGKFDCTF